MLVCLSCSSLPRPLLLLSPVPLSFKETILGFVALALTLLTWISMDPELEAMSQDDQLEVPG